MLGWSEASVNVAQVLDPNVEVLRRWGFQVAFGQRFGIPNNTTTDIWAGAGLIRPLPLAAKAMSVVSTDAADNGTKFFAVSFIDADGDWRYSDLLPLNGLSAVPITYKPSQALVTAGTRPTFPDGTSTTASIFRVQDVAVFIAVGATEAAPRVTNVGTLNVIDAAVPTTIFDVVPAGFGRSQSAAFHVPRNYLGLLTKVQVGTAKGQGQIDIAATFGPGTAFQILPLTPLTSATVIFDNDAATTPIESQSDIQALVVTDSQAIDVSCILQIRLKPTQLLIP